MNDAFPAGALRPPSIGLLGTEPLRAALEYVGLKLMDRAALPAGDGHPVVLFPGLASDRRALLPLRRHCESLGYAAHDWPEGFNTGPRGGIEPWLQRLAAFVTRIAQTHGRPASLIGWSLGGVYAREIAKLVPRQTRLVITLGTPFRASGSETNAAWLYALLSGQPAAIDEALARRLRGNPPVPTSAIYSRSDGIVAWQTCVLDEGPQHENVEVEGSHVGMGWNAHVLRIVADRLAQREGGWRPFAGGRADLPSERAGQGPNA